jgi:undecaprenyl diphosphate synthase
MPAPLTRPPADSRFGAIPRHIAVIMDGNGRWAREQGLQRIRGHERGAEAVRDCLTGCGELGVEFLTLYAFSAENWKRPRPEVTALMALLERFLRKETPELIAKNVRLHAIGRLAELPESCQRELREAIDATAGNTGTTLILALSYSSRVEILDAVRSLIRAVEAGELDKEKIDAATFSDHLYTRSYPDPELLIRTSGEMRISNFLLWQLSYTEIWVTRKYWPDFRKEDLFDAIEDYGKRQRRFGGV